MFLQCRAKVLNTLKSHSFELQMTITRSFYCKSIHSFKSFICQQIERTFKAKMCCLHKYSTSSDSFLIEPPFAAETDPTSFACCLAVIITHSSWQICSRLLMLVGCLTAIFKPCHRVSIGFRSWLWLGTVKHSPLFLTTPAIALALCSRPSSC